MYQVRGAFYQDGEAFYQDGEAFYQDGEAFYQDGEAPTVMRLTLPLRPFTMYMGLSMSSLKPSTLYRLSLALHTRPRHR